VLEQDRVMLEEMEPDANQHENLYQHDMGIVRLRRHMRNLAKQQLEQAGAAGLKRSERSHVIPHAQRAGAHHALRGRRHRERRVPTGHAGRGLSRLRGRLAHRPAPAQRLVRSYSLCNPSSDRERYVVGVLNDRKSRGGSRYVHQQLRVGMTLPISRRATTSSCTRRRAHRCWWPAASASRPSGACCSGWWPSAGRWK
jgi:hypothetical protein